MSAPNVADVDAGGDARWSVAGTFLEALARRDFVALRACLDPSVPFRALVPSGPFELHGSHDTVERFQSWFGEHQVFELIDASIGQIGEKVYLRWRILRAASAFDPNTREIVEQHVFATIADRVESLDLLCSGFHAERPGQAVSDREAPNSVSTTPQGGTSRRQRSVRSQEPALEEWRTACR